MPKEDVNANRRLKSINQNINKETAFYIGSLKNLDLIGDFTAFSFHRDKLLFHMFNIRI